MYSFNLLHCLKADPCSYNNCDKQSCSLMYIMYIQYRYDAWLTTGISRYLAYQYRKATFGNNEYRFTIRQVSIASLYILLI